MNAFKTLPMLGAIAGLMSCGSAAVHLSELTSLTPLTESGFTFQSERFDTDGFIIISAHRKTCDETNLAVSIDGLAVPGALTGGERFVDGLRLCEFSTFTSTYSIEQLPGPTAVIHVTGRDGTSAYTLPLTCRTGRSCKSEIPGIVPQSSR